MMSIKDHVAISVETPMINSRCSLGREFIELIHTNILIILYLIVNQVDSCHDCVYSPLA